MKRLVVVICMVLVAWTAAAAELQIECPQGIEVGLPIQVRVDADQPVDKLLVEWDGRAVQIPGFKEKTVQVLLGTDAVTSAPGQKELRVTKLGLNPVVASLAIEVHKREAPVDRLLDDDAGAPQPTERRRIIAECAKLLEAVEAVTPVNNLQLPLNRPVGGRLVNLYGKKKPVEVDPLDTRRGVDFQAMAGEIVQAASPGQVVLVAEHYYAGKFVVIDHGLGVFSLYMHLLDQTVTAGRTVEAGEMIGHVGQTGHVRDSRLHFALSILGRFVDPSPLFYKVP